VSAWGTGVLDNPVTANSALVRLAKNRARDPGRPQLDDRGAGPSLELQIVMP
jgi:hypothetical protein